LSSSVAVLGEDHRDLAGPLASLATVYLETGEPAKAIEPLERGLRIVGEDVAPEILAEGRFMLARAYGESGRDRRRALELARQAQETLRAAGEGHEDTIAEIEAWIRGFSRP